MDVGATHTDLQQMRRGLPGGDASDDRDRHGDIADMEFLVCQQNAFSPRLRMLAGLGTRLSAGCSAVNVMWREATPAYIRCAGRVGPPPDGVCSGR